MIDESTYDTLLTGLGWERPESIQANQIRLVDPFYDERFSDKVDTFEWEGQTFDVTGPVKQSPLNLATFGGTFYVVADDVFNAMEEPVTTYQVALLEDYKEQMVQSDRLADLPNFSSAPAVYRDVMAANGALLFVGTFLGLVFLVATGSVIYFKTMTEAEEDRTNYRILRNVGMSRKEICRTIRQQIGVVFLAPYLLGLLHASVALVAFSHLLMMDFTVPVLVWMALYSMIYGLYYGLTVRRFERAVL